MSTVSESRSGGLFVREATGLVREMSWFDTFLCGFGILNVALGLVQAFAYAPYVFPGSNMALAFVIVHPEKRTLPPSFFAADLIKQRIRARAKTTKVAGTRHSRTGST